MTPTERQREFRKRYYAAKKAASARKPRDPLAKAQPQQLRQPEPKEET